MADTTNASLTSQGIRLECLRLAQRPDKDTEWITKRAAEFERFVVGEPEQPTEPAPATTETTAEAAPETTGKAKATSRSKSS